MVSMYNELKVSDGTLFKREIDENSSEVWIKTEQKDCKECILTNEDVKDFNESEWNSYKEIKLEVSSTAYLKHEEIDLDTVFNIDAACDGITNNNPTKPLNCSERNIKPSGGTSDAKYSLFFCKRKSIGIDTFQGAVSDDFKQKVICYYCHFKTRSLKTLKCHILEHLGMGSRHKLRSRKTNLKSLKRKFSKKKKFFVCKVCGYKSGNSYRMKIHTRTHTGEKPFTCSICNLSVSRRGNFKNHLKTHSGERPYRCGECPYRAVNKNTLKNHIMRFHTGERPYSCSLCNFTSVTNYHLKRHLGRIHMKTVLKSKEKVKQLSCSACAFKASNNSSLSRHFNTKHADQLGIGSSLINDGGTDCKDKFQINRKTDSMGKPYVCSECPYISTGKYGMKIHFMRRHTRERPFSCTACTFKTSTNYHLKRHFNNVHTKEKHFACNPCTLKTKVHYLKTQLIKEQGKNRINNTKDKTLKQFSCTLCRFKASTKSCLNDHMNIIHTSKISPASDVTNTTDGDLKMTTKTNSKNKPFRCNECNFATPVMRKMKLHIMRHHSREKPFSCNACDFKTTTNYHLKRHFNSIHAKRKSSKNNFVSNGKT